MRRTGSTCAPPAHSPRTPADRRPPASSPTPPPATNTTTARGVRGPGINRGSGRCQGFVFSVRRAWEAASVGLSGRTVVVLASLVVRRSLLGRGASAQKGENDAYPAFDARFLFLRGREPVSSHARWLGRAV